MTYGTMICFAAAAILLWGCGGSRVPEWVVPASIILVLASFVYVWYAVTMGTAP